MATVCSVCWFLGVVVFGVVERMHTDVTHPTDVSPPDHVHSMLLASAGGLTYVTGVAGYWGSLHLEHGLVCVFKYIVLVSGLIEVSIGGFALAYSGQAIEQDTMRYVKKSFRDHDFFFDLQEQLKCCGSESPSDWVGAFWWNKQRMDEESRQVVPHSCCINTDRKDTSCQEGPPPYTKVADPTLIHQQGCHAIVVGRRHDLLLSSGIVSCVCGMIKLASFVTIHCFAKSIHAKQRRIEELRHQPATDFTEIKKKAEQHYRARISRLRDA